MTKIPTLARELGVTPARIYSIISAPEFESHVIVEGRNKTLTDTGVSMVRERCQGVVKELSSVVNSLTTENESLKYQLAELQTKYTEVLEESREQAIRDKERYAELLAVIAQSQQPHAIEDKAEETHKKKAWFQFWK
jgi:regulator of replication initiation timing